MHQLTLVTLVLVALCSVGDVDSSAYDKIVYHSRVRARSQGPNMCSLQQVPGTNKKYFSTCQNWYRGSICGKKAKVLYECCPGYVKMEGMKGCTGVAPIDNVYGTLGLVQATTTQQYAEMSKLRDELEAKGSITMFAPSNEAWNELDSEVRSALESNVNIELYNALHFHMVNRRFLTKDLKNDLTLTSLYNDLGLYINHYPNGVVTVNCARIIHANQIASNGVVHVIDRVIGFVSNTIKGALDANEDLSSFSAAALASGMMEKLDKPGHYTLFAPTNAAFNKLAPGHLERIMGDKAVIAALVNYHLLNTAQCSEAIMSGTTYETAEGSTIQIGCDGDGLTVNGIKMVLKKDIVTTNGVIHLIDSVLIPDSAKEVKELLGETQSTFGEMVSELGLAAALGPKTQYTLLAPINSAFPKEVMTTDQSLLRYILENHILKFKVTLSELYNGQTLKTLAGKLLRVFIYRTAVCIENSCMTRGAKEGSNGALHVMRSIIKPPEKNIYELLIADGRFKIFLSLMETAGLTDLLKQEGSYTAFAPTDDAFEGLTQEDITLLKSDLNALRVILLYHFSNGILINGGLEGGVTNLLKTLQGNNLQVMSVNNSIHVNSVGVPDSDLMATNGVIHVVKNVLYPADLPVGRQDLLVLLKKLIKYIQIKFISGFTYTEIPITFIKRTITTTYVETVPDSRTVVRVIEGVQKEPTITKVTRVIEAEPTVTQVIEEEPVVTKVTRVIDTEPTVTETVVDDKPVVTKVTRVIKTEPTVTKVVVEEEPVVTTVTRVVKGESSQTTLTRVTGENPSISKVTRVIQGGKLNVDGQRISGGTRFTEGFEPHIIQVPDLSRITTIHGDPSLIEEESERITKIIKEGGKYAAARKAPAGMRRRQRLVRRHHKPKQ